MIDAKYQWIQEDTTEEIDRETIETFNLSSIMVKILQNKGFTSKESIQAIIGDDHIYHSPYLLSDMEKAVERIKRAIEKEEPILVYGDYDADGVTSTTILVETLRSLNAIVTWYIPNRFTEGYGPSELAFRNAHDEGVQLIITVDNGIQGHQEIDIANELGVDVIVTDHHEIGDTLPNAYAIVHPMHPEYEYPFSYLCGAGVALKLSQALIDQVPNYYWSLASIGTIADLVSLTNENRTIVKKGLAYLNEDIPVSIEALLQQAQYEGELTEETIGFVIGPRLNAVGRLEDAQLAAELLMAEDKEEAEFLAEQVEYFNNERKSIVQSLTEEAMQLAAMEVEAGHRFLVLAQENWHEGVLGIVASRIVEQYHLPTIILNLDTDYSRAKGSARSISQISMFEALNQNQYLIEKFGGHHMAAGLTLPIENVEQLKTALNEWMDKTVSDIDLKPTCRIDALIDEADITIDNIASIERLRPFGMDFEKPTFQLNQMTINQVKAIGQNNKHLKLNFQNQGLQALFWNNGELAQSLMMNQNIDMIGQLQINEWNGHRTPQLVVKDLYSKEIQILDYRSKSKRLPQFEDKVCYIIHPQVEKSKDNEYYYGEVIPEQYDKCVFRDLPRALADMENTLNHLSSSQIYLVFDHKHSIYFDGLPQREVFKNCYKWLYHNKEFNLVKDGLKLSQFLKIKPEILKFVLKVFLELGLITQNNDMISLVTTNQKHDIEASRYYQARKQRIEVEKHLLYQDYQTIKMWIQNQLSHES
ncbi:single-stranded-DNA-specific exonuclease RecJ [Staphylococcus sp. 11261D007BR]